jgi:hypothetical protein
MYGVGAKTHKELDSEVLMTLAPVINEGVSSFCLEDEEQLLPYGYIREIFGYKMEAQSKLMSNVRRIFGERFREKITRNPKFIEGPIRRPERGELMGADKNSSRRMNSAYAPNPQTRIPTRACQGRVVTKDLPTLGTSPKPIQHRSTTQKARDLGNLENTRRTVRSVRADCPRGGRGLSARRARTVRNCYPNLQYCTEKMDHP